MEQLTRDRILQFFTWEHLPAELQDIPRRFAELAEWLCASERPSPERTVALRKLLEAKDAAVRSHFYKD